MRAFLLALQFLTTIPVRLSKPPEGRVFARAVFFFPVVGFLLAMAIAVVDIALAPFFPALLTSLLLVASMTVLTGALHLDGLADTFDALGSGKDREGMLAIMRDSHVGAMGVLSLVTVFLTKIIVLADIPRARRPFVVAAMLVVSRWSMAVMIHLFEYARPEGKAREFMRNKSRAVLIASSLLTLLVVLAVVGVWGALLLAGTGIVAFGFCRFTALKLGGITGDVLGAVNEIAECSFLVSACLLIRLGGIG